MAEISAQSSVSSLQSLSVHLNPRSLLGLTTLVAAFLNSSKCGSYGWYRSWSPGTLSSDRNMIPDKEECWQHALGLFIQLLRWDKSPRHSSSSTARVSYRYHARGKHFGHSGHSQTNIYTNSLPANLSGTNVAVAVCAWLAVGCHCWQIGTSASCLWAESSKNAWHDWTKMAASSKSSAAVEGEIRDQENQPLSFVLYIILHVDGLAWSNKIMFPRPWEYTTMYQYIHRSIPFSIPPFHSIFHSSN